MDDLKLINALVSRLVQKANSYKSNGDRMGFLLILIGYIFYTFIKKNWLTYESFCIWMDTDDIPEMNSRVL